MATVTLQAYERAEQELAVRDAVVGLRIHAVVTVLVWAVLIPVNIILAPEFPWSAFVVLGMAIGLFAHWFGYRHTEDNVRQRQPRIEQRAQTGMPTAS